MLSHSPEQLCTECLEVEKVLDLNLSLLFHDLARQEGNKEPTAQEKRYLCLLLAGYQPIDIARKEKEKYLISRYSQDQEIFESTYQKPFISQTEYIDNGIKNRARDIRTYISRNLAPKIKTFIANLPNVRESEETLKDKISWGRIVCILRTNGYKKQVIPRERIELEYEGVVKLKKIFALLKKFESELGPGLLNIEAIEQQLEDNEVENEYR